jgi:hypothetical protein
MKAEFDSDVKQNDAALEQSQLVEMEEDREYQRQLDLFVHSSTEKSIELIKVGEIISELSSRRSFLDIGAGGGDLTIPRIFLKEGAHNFMLSMICGVMLTSALNFLILSYVHMFSIILERTNG